MDIRMKNQLFGMVQPTSSKKKPRPALSQIIEKMKESARKKGTDAAILYACENCGQLRWLNQEGLNALADKSGNQNVNSDRSYFLVRKCVWCAEKFESPILKEIIS